MSFFTSEIKPCLVSSFLNEYRQADTVDFKILGAPVRRQYFTLRTWIITVISRERRKDLETFECYTQQHTSQK